MRLGILLFVPLLFGAPMLSMRWADGGRKSVEVRSEKPDEFLVQCAKSGAEVQYRYQVQLCRKREMWFAACGREHLYVRSLKYDAISDSYRTRIDKLGDSAEPLQSSVSGLDAALAAVTSLETVPLELFKSEPERISRDARYYLRVRVLSECKGETDSTAARIATVLTLGLVSGGDDSGWINFELAP